MDIEKTHMVSFLLLVKDTELKIPKSVLYIIASQFGVSENEVSTFYEPKEHFQSISLEISVPEHLSIINLGPDAYLKQLREAHATLEGYAPIKFALLSFGSIRRTIFLTKNDHELLEYLGSYVKEMCKVEPKQNINDLTIQMMINALAQSIDMAIIDELLSKD